MRVYFICFAFGFLLGIKTTSSYPILSSVVNPTSSVTTQSILPTPKSAKVAIEDDVEEVVDEFPDFVISDEDFAKQREYINKYLWMAKETKAKYGVPVSITLSQAILESGSGGSSMARQIRNHFGIKCFSKKCKKGHCERYCDEDCKQFFVKYKTVKQSFMAHGAMLGNPKSRYAVLHKYTNYKDWTLGLKNCGYATGKKYNLKLNKIIQKHKLDKYDDA
jgi:flagellum-specific peptidoglycan hydrolase FlgJ